MSTWVVVGGGATGLALARAGLDAGQRVLLLEQKHEIGGLTSSIDLQADDIPVGVDRFYHVILESDSQVLKLLDRVGMRERVRWASAPASIIANATRYPATNLIDMARLPALALPTRALIGLSIAFSLLLPGFIANRITAQRWLIATAGRNAYRNFWAPILRAKLGNQASRVSAAFLVSTFRRLVRARLSGAGDRFGVLPGGYAEVFCRIRQQIIDRGGELRTDAEVSAIAGVTGSGTGGRICITLANGEQLHCDDVFVTAPGPSASALLPQLTADEHHRLTSAPYLGVLCGVFLVRRPPTDSYITYLVDDIDLTGVIGMHALLPANLTGGAALIYLPRYCASDDDWFSLSDDQVRDRLLTELGRCLPDYQPDVLDWAISRAPHVVPLPLPHTCKPLPYRTSVPGVHVVSTAQNTSGTLNVETSLRQAAVAVANCQKGLE